MRRKKIPTDADMIDAIPELDENEQFVIQDTRTIRKETLPPDVQPEQKAESVSDDDAEDGEIFEDRRYSETSLASLLYDEQETPAENQYGSVNVRRNPDSMKDRFLQPCSSVLNYPPLRNVELSAEKSDIEETVRNLYGGGHYFFQLNFNNRLGPSWKVSLADPPELIAQAKAEKQAADRPAPPVVTQPPPVNPFQQRIDELKLEREYDEIKFGPERRKLERMETELEELRRAAAVPPTPVNQSETLTILEKALSTTNPTIQEKLLDYAFPPKDESNSHWIVDLFKTVMDNKAELAGMAGMLLGGGVPQPKPQSSMEAFLKAQPPNALPPNVPPVESEPVRSNFQRRKPEPPPAEEPETIIDAEDLGERVDEGNTGDE